MTFRTCNTSKKTFTYQNNNKRQKKQQSKPLTIIKNELRKPENQNILKIYKKSQLVLKQIHKDGYLNGKEKDIRKEVRKVWVRHKDLLLLVGIRLKMFLPLMLVLVPKMLREMSKRRGSDYVSSIIMILLYQTT